MCKRQEHLGRKQWEFINTWGFPYKVRFSSGDLDIALVKYEKKITAYTRQAMMILLNMRCGQGDLNMILCLKER